MKKTTKLLIILSLFPIIIITISLFFILNSNKLPTIQNLSDYTSQNESDDQVINAILNSLNETLKLNHIQDPSSVNDIYIRDGSFSQQEKDNFYITSFIVDSKNLQQSYKVSYSWDHQNHLNVIEDGYNGTFLCLSSDDPIIYQNFNCNDISTNMSGTNDPDAKKLPHIVDGKYRLTYQPRANKVVLDIFACINTYTDTIEKEAKQWLKENNISLDKLYINYCATH